MISVADLIAYRQQREQLIERVGAFEVVTEAGPARVIAYATPFDRVHHLALVVGDLDGGGDVLVRIQREEVIDDVFARRDGQGGHGIPQALRRLRANRRGVLIYLREGTVGVPGRPSCRRTAPRRRRPRPPSRRAAGSGTTSGSARRSCATSGSPGSRLLATGHRRYVGLSGFGIDIVATELLEG